jgi:hypothetical protein
LTQRADHTTQGAGEAPWTSRGLMWKVLLGASETEMRRVFGRHPGVPDFHIKPLDPSLWAANLTRGPGSRLRPWPGARMLGAEHVRRPVAEILVPPCVYSSSYSDVRCARPGLGLEPRRLLNLHRLALDLALAHEPEG